VNEVISPPIAHGARAIHLTARPEPLQIGLEQTALIVVDMQNAYASSGGYLDLAGFDISMASGVIKQTRIAIEASRAAGVPVFYLQNGWDQDYIEAGGPGSPNWYKSNALKTMRKRPELAGTLLAKGGWDYEILDSLAPQDVDIIVPKPRYSAFFNTNFDSLLRSRGIRNLMFTGVATNVCVESTLRDGFHLEYFCVLLDDACGTIGPDFAHQATVWNVEKFFGWVSSVSDYTSALLKAGKGSPAPEVADKKDASS
jgi:ureidoacrylate peracid hydrolase